MTLCESRAAANLRIVEDVIYTIQREQYILRLKFKVALRIKQRAAGHSDRENHFLLELGEI